jgi:serine/threonine protein kinase
MRRVDADPAAQIGDYGASTVYRLPWEKTVHMSTGLCGSEPYIAPEQFLHKRTFPHRTSTHTWRAR